MKARDNPFRSECLAEIPYRFEKVSLADSARELAILGWRAAVVGPHGSGKTTFLREMRAWLIRAGFRVHHLVLTEECAHFPPGFMRQISRGLAPDDFILLDGCEQMNGVEWFRFKWLTRGAAGLLITTHREGRLPTLLQTRASPALIGNLVRDLTGRGAEASLCHRLYQAHGGNVREVLRELYDLCAEDKSLDRFAPVSV